MHNIQTVETYPVDDGIGYRTHPGVKITAATIGVLCLGVLIYFRRGAFYLLFIPIVICALLLFSSEKTSAIVTEQQYRWINGWGEETVVDLTEVDRVVVKTDKEYGRYGTRIDIDAFFYFSDGTSTSVPYSRSSPSGLALDAVFERLKSRGIIIKTVVTGNAR